MEYSSLIPCSNHDKKEKNRNIIKNILGGLHMKKIKLCFTVAAILFITYPVSAESLPLPISSKSSPSQYKKIETEGKVVFRYKSDFKSLAKFLNITEKEYFQLRKQKSMLEVAQMQGVSQKELFNYLASQQYKALKSAYYNKQIDLDFVMDYVLHLKEDLYWEMNVKK